MMISARSGLTIFTRSAISSAVGRNPSFVNTRHDLEDARLFLDGTDIDRDDLHLRQGFGQHQVEHRLLFSPFFQDGDRRVLTEKLGIQPADLHLAKLGMGEPCPALEALCRPGPRRSISGPRGR